MNKWSSKKRLSLASVVALCFGVLSPLPASASVVESCTGASCTVTFAFSSQMQTFTPPSNAKNLTFEAYGAQGGKSGGGGGLVTGALIQIPEVLYVFVGGVGGSGAGAPGGFNGGGVAGSGSGMEGSGGGASDIRTGPELSSRIVVAGGGGGKGAGLGSGGGAGGGLVAVQGRTAQGFGGNGGSQDSGGLGGAANGSGTAGLAGTLGVGGAGGSSSLYGGGGGGGGYFGGGGGGSDTDSCCTDAGGGGGGSSYTDQAIVSNTVHTQGVRPGSGLVILRYQLAPFVTSISQTVSGNQVSFQIDFDSAVSGFEVSDLEIDHSSGSCASILLSGSEQSYQLLVSDCDDGQVSILVKADSVSRSEVSGPITQFASETVLIDTQEPPTVESEPEPELEEPVSEPAPVEEPEEPIASEPEEETAQEISSTPTEEVVREEPVESPTEIQQPSFADAPAADSDQPVESPVSNPGFQDQITSAPEPDQSSDGPTNGPTYEQTEDSSDELLAPGIFTSPPASSLPQASQTVIIPAQGFGSGFGLNGLTFGLMALGLFALGAGLVVARRGIPGVLSS